MDSDSETMLSEKVTSTASENRKNSKPIMEKRRRARINASLTELKALLLEVTKKEGTRQNKMEKADILEITVRHLRTLQMQQFSALAASDPSVINKYRLGFNECASQVSNFLGSMEGTDAEIRATLLNHLANCMVNPDPPGQSGGTPSVLGSERLTLSPPANRTFFKSEEVTSTHPHQIVLPDSSNTQNVIQSGLTTCTIDNGVLAIRSQEPLVTNSISASLPTSTTASLSIQGIINGQPMQIHQPQLQPQAQPIPQYQPQLVQQPLQAQQQQQLQIQTIQPQPTLQTQPNLHVQNVVSGVQLIPTKMSTGEMAFIIPANLLSSGNINNYVIPMVQPQAYAPQTALTSQPGQMTALTTQTALTSQSALTSHIITPVAPVTATCTQSTSPVEGVVVSNITPPRSSQTLQFKPFGSGLITRPRQPAPVYEQAFTSNSEQPIICVRDEQLRNRTTDRSGQNYHSMSPCKDDDMWRPW